LSLFFAKKISAQSEKSKDFWQIFLDILQNKGANANCKVQN